MAVSAGIMVNGLCHGHDVNEKRIFNKHACIRLIRKGGAQGGV